MKKIVLLLALFISGAAFAQSESLNNYKYIIIPEKFEFFKEANKYELNNLTKLAFEKYGFTVLYDTEQLPPEIALNRCRALYGNLVNDSGMLSTAISIIIKDCTGKEIFLSEKGKSKVKDYKKAYFEATRKASASLANLNYQYAGDEVAGRYWQQTSPVPAVVTSQSQQAVSQQVNVAPTPVSAPAVSAVPVNNENQLFAQPITNGYQLIDTTPKIVLKMYKTSQPDSYSAQAEGKNGVVFKKGNEWFFEYYQNDKLISEKLNIKF